MLDGYWGWYKNTHALRIFPLCVTYHSFTLRHPFLYVLRIIHLLYIYAGRLLGVEVYEKKSPKVTRSAQSMMTDIGLGATCLCKQDHDSYTFMQIPNIYGYGYIIVDDDETGTGGTCPTYLSATNSCTTYLTSLESSARLNGSEKHVTEAYTMEVKACHRLVDNISARV
ncbi:unnamed protein product [Sphenostylis stenocarpa]|uniref:Uncharacterized protein n=1 Tax=Sphenostylis stenocarpa TaxID=92480 RepID=A0AA86SM93_9FABA|nr:unnamed protein product [Sphenostylis stenocarpa]